MPDSHFAYMVDMRGNVVLWADPAYFAEGPPDPETMRAEFALVDGLVHGVCYDPNPAVQAFARRLLGSGELCTNETVRLQTGEK